MVESTIDKIKDITVERQIRKLAGVIDEQNQKIEAYGDATTDINNLKVSDANQNTEINKLKTTTSEHTTDINELKASDANQTTQINNLKQSVATDKLATESAITALQNKDAEQDGTLTNHATLIQGITESLVSNVQIMSGTTTGDIKVRLERESAATIDSNNYNLGLPVSAEIIQGTGPSMFKIQITMSTGVKVVSNDFVFTTEAIGNDVYISSFTFKAGNQSGYLSADIGLNNGITIEANNFLVPTDPNVTSAIADLQTRLTTVENSGITDISGLKTTVNEHTSEINTLNSDVADLMTNKADFNNSRQTITAGTINATNINKNGVSVATVNDIPSVPDISGKADLNNSSQTIVAGTISATNITKGGVDVATINDIPTSSGEVWEEIDLANIPNDWRVGDRIKVKPSIYKPSVPSTATTWTSDISGITYSTNPYRAPVIEFELDSKSAAATTFVPIHMEYNNVMFNITYIRCTLEPSKYTTDSNMFYLGAVTFNGHGLTKISTAVTSSNITKYIVKMWRLKK